MASYTRYKSFISDGTYKKVPSIEVPTSPSDFYVYYDEEDKCVGIGLYNDKKYETTLRNFNIFC